MTRLKLEEAKSSSLYTATPAWIKELCPQLPAILPSEIVDEICKSKKQVETESHRYRLDERAQLQHSISLYLNNFVLLIIDRDYKDKKAIPKRDRSPQYPISEKLRGKTWGEFYTDIDSALARTVNFTPQTIKDLDKQGDRAALNIKLLPPFVELRK